MKFSQVVSSSARKNRKNHFDTTSTQRRELMASPLSKELRQKYNVRSLPIRKGDEVMVIRGSNHDYEGVVTHVHRRNFVINVERITRKKTNGDSVPIGIHPSNVVITKLKLNKDRRELLARRSHTTQKGKYSNQDISNLD
ncbi:putative 60S ribosomal protein L26 [Cryptosporidium serpentis]